MFVARPLSTTFGAVDINVCDGPLGGAENQAPQGIS